MRTRLAAALSVFVLSLTGVATQQPPAAAPAAAGRGARPLVPVAASTIAANPDRYAGTMVTVTAAVVERLGATAFSVVQGRNGQDILVVAPLLTAPVQPGAYVTVLGEVVTFDPAVMAARMKDAAPALTPDVVARYSGRPAIIASSVINGAMTDLAKKLPPPMTAQELVLNKAMKQIGPGFTALRQAVTGGNTSETRAQATTIANGFVEAAAFWKATPHADAVQWTEDARKLSEEIAAAAARSDLEAVKSAVPKLQQACSSCHTQYRERLDDGSYRYKAR